MNHYGISAIHWNAQRREIEGLQMIANAIRVLAVVGVWVAAFFDLRFHDFGWASFDWIQLLIVVACAALAFGLAWIIDGFANREGST